MHIGAEILKMLVPENIKWTIYGDEYSGIVWHSEEPYITEEEFEQGKINLSSYLQQKENDKIAKKEIALSKLEELGLTEEDIKAILG